MAPRIVTTPYLVVGGTDSRYFEPVSYNIYRFLPMSVEVDDVKRLHGTNERIGVETYGTAIRFYRRRRERGWTRDGGVSSAARRGACKTAKPKRPAVRPASATLGDTCPWGRADREAVTWRRSGTG